MDWYPSGSNAAPKSCVNADAATSLATTLSTTAGNVIGSWVEVTPSWAGVGGFSCAVTPAAGDALMDIAIGAAGSEVVIVENMYVGSASVSRFLWPIAVPLQIANGERVSARLQHSATDGTATLYVDHVFYPVTFGRCTTYGANTTDSGGVLIDPGASANTKGAWSEITASCTNDVKAMLLALGHSGDTARVLTRLLIDIGVGAAGSEVVVVSNYSAAVAATHDSLCPGISQLMDVQIPAGSRIAVRAQCDVTTTDRYFDAIIYGFD